MSRTKPERRNTFVLARAFGDEPLKLPMKGLADGIAELDLGDGTALFPEQDVYSFDEELFRRLSGAFGAGRKSELSKLWSEAVRVA